VSECAPLVHLPLRRSGNMSDSCGTSAPFFAAGMPHLLASPRCTLSECRGGDGGGAVALQRSTVEEWKMWSGDRNRGSEGVRE
jgi:hypothetical protein